MIFGRKYRNVFTEYNGRTYHSKAEARRAQELDFQMRAGAIKWWMPQPRFTLGLPELVYVADFLVQDDKDQCHVEDVKGVSTQKFKRDLKLWRAYGKLPLWILKAKGLRWDITIVVPESS